MEWSGESAPVKYKWSLLREGRDNPERAMSFKKYERGPGGRSARPQRRKPGSEEQICVC